MRRCLGIKKSLNRCKNECNWLYCGFHKLQPLFILFFLASGIIFFTDLAESLGFEKRPIEYVKEKFRFNNQKSNEIIRRTKNKIRLGVIEFLDMELDKNVYNIIYVDELNKLANIDNLQVEAFPINFSHETKLTKGKLQELIESNDLDIIVWGKVSDNKCNEENLYCVNYELSNNSLATSSSYSSTKSLQEFNQGSLHEFLSGQFSGDLHKILYYTSVFSESIKGNYEVSNSIIEKNKIRNSEDSNFMFWEAFNNTRLRRFKIAKDIYQEIIQDTINKCEKYYTSSLSNLASFEKDQGEVESNLNLNLRALNTFIECGNQDTAKLTLLYNYVAQSYNSFGKKDSSRLYHNKAFNLMKKGIGYANDIPVMLSNMAAFSIETGDYLSATNECLLALEYVTEDHNDILGIIYFHLGLARKKRGDYMGGILSLRMAKDHVEERGNLYHATSMAIVSELGWSAFMTNNDSIVSELKFIIDSIYVTNKLSPIDKFKYYEFNAAYYSLMKSDNFKAIELYNSALKEAEKMKYNNLGIIATTYNNLAGVYDLVGNEKMKRHYHKLYGNATDNNK